MIGIRGAMGGLLALVLAGCATANAGSPVVAPQEAGVEAARLSEHVRILSDDSFQGREPGTDGERMTLDYLQAQYEAMGLEPGGPNGQWRQPVTLTRYTPAPGGSVRASMRNGLTVNLTGAANAALVRATYGDGRAQFEGAPVVFAGYGISAPDRGWDDYAGIDVEGAVVIVLMGEPDDDRFNGEYPSLYGLDSYKTEEAHRRGALAVLNAIAVQAGSAQWRGIAGYVGRPSTQVVGVENIEASGYLAMEPLMGWIRSNDGDPEQWFAEAASGQFRARRLEGVTLSMDIQEQVDTIQTYNLLARIPGTDRPDDTVIVSAHWDHVGVADTPDGNGDLVYNGAWDNASGTAGVLELARVLHARGPRPRSIVFAHMAAEEMGLLGSHYYVEHPVWPLETTVADVNIDMLPLSPPTRDLAIFGYGQTTLEDDLARLAAIEGRVVTDDGRPDEGFYYRSDHFPFALAGVPALMVWHGVDWDEGGRDVGAPAYRQQWDQYYHERSDEWSADIDWRSAVENLDLLEQLVADLADGDQWPDWKPGSEFLATRAQSASARQ
ncbi:M28 family peptidase [Brevundimonas aveniformis]|uniref:M28 family peptidase n=1 Tax=Brevundimonas aveniformis TaxID=370977 RepID=UPI002492AD71|nr:M28 family peptidase [Brevundimonas aveniformis]